MYTEEEFERVEQEERLLTDEQIAIMLVLLDALGSDLENELRNFYQKYGKDGVVTYSEARKWVSEQDHRRRLTVLMLFVNDRFSSLLTKLQIPFETMQRNVIGKEIEFFGVEVDVDALVLAVWGADSLNWLDRLTNDVNLWKYRVMGEIKQALHKGSSINEIIEIINNRVKSMKKVLNSLGLTESTAIGSEARREIFKELGITKYRFYTKADERTCETCGALHGLTFPISAYEIGVTASPCHPRCRCWEEPITE